MALKRCPLEQRGKPVKILFCHIPKNAGTAITSLIQPHFPTWQVWAPHWSELVFNQFMADKSGIIDNNSFIAGHIPLEQIEGFLPRFDHIFAVVRHPADRALSMYEFMKITGAIPEGMDLDEFFHTYFAGNIATRNQQCGYLGKENTFHSVADRLSDLPSLKVFTMEQLGHLDAVLHDIGFRQDEGLTKINVTEGRSLKWDQVDKKLQREIYQWFDGDVTLYDYLTNSPAFGPREIPSMIPL